MTKQMQDSFKADIPDQFSRRFVQFAFDNPADILPAVTAQPGQPFDAPAVQAPVVKSPERFPEPVRQPVHGVFQGVLQEFQQLKNKKIMIQSGLAVDGFPEVAEDLNLPLGQAKRSTPVRLPGPEVISDGVVLTNPLKGGFFQRQVHMNHPVGLNSFAAMAVSGNEKHHVASSQKSRFSVQPVQAVSLFYPENLIELMGVLAPALPPVVGSLEEIQCNVQAMPAPFYGAHRLNVTYE